MNNKTLAKLISPLVLLIFLLLVSGGLHGDDPDLEPLSLNLEQVRTLALLNSRSLARADLSVMNSLLNQRSHYFSMLPSLTMRYDAQVRYLNNDWELIEQPMDTLSSSLTISLSHRLFDGGKNLILMEINAISVQSARREALAEYFNVIDSADSAYYAVLEAAAALEAEESSLQTAIFSLSMAEIRQESGMINQGDYLRALADKEVRENSRNQARRNYALSSTRLMSLTGLSVLPPLEEIDLSVYEELILHLGSISDEEVDILFQKLWQYISVVNPSMARSASNLLTAERNLSLTKRDFAPTITASIFSPSLNYSRLNGLSDSSGGGGVSITGSIPIDFWNLNNRIERSQISVDSAALDYINAERSLEIDLYTLLFTIVGNSGSVLSSRRTLDHAEKHFEFVLERYRLLQSSISDLQEASTMLINSQNSHSRSLYGFLQNLSRLRSMGLIEEEEFLFAILMG
ncbi:MAG: TolC family protein [Treponema sp.]|nr:TolC family protein [Treponema sp.]